MQRLCASWRRVGCAQIKREDFVAVMAEFVLELCRLVKAAKDFLIPVPELGATQIGDDRVRLVPEVPMALRQVEGIARDQKRIGFGLQRALQNQGILAVGLGVPTPGPIVIAPHHDAQMPGRPRTLACQEFMQYAAVAPRQRVAHELNALVRNARIVEVEHVGIGGQFRQPETAGDLERVVRIDDQRISAERTRERERFGSIVSEVLPWALVQFAGHILQVFANDVLRTVGRTGVDDYPVVDDRTHRIQAATDHRRLVLDDHVQADGDGHRMRWL